MFLAFDQDVAIGRSTASLTPICADTARPACTRH